MPKYNALYYYGFILLTLFFVQSPTLSAQQAASPLKQCWNLNVSEISKTAIASDNVKTIYIVSERGILYSINAIENTQNWKSELGGITAKIVFDNGYLYVLSFGEDENKKTIALRALSRETGVTKWQKTLNVNPGIEHDNLNSLLVQNGNFIFLVTSAGDLYTLQKDNGEIVEKNSFNEAVTAEANIIDRNIIFGTAQKNLISYSTADMKISKTALNDVPTIVYNQRERIIIGDRNGKLTAFKTSAGKYKKEWQIRVGAEISSISETADGLAVSSNDNFIYLISSKNGKKVWKRRFAGRTASAFLLKPESALIAINLNGDSASLLDVKSGKIINQITLPNGGFFIGKPLPVNDSVIFLINTGLIAYSLNPDNCQKEKDRN